MIRLLCLAGLLGLFALAPVAASEKDRKTAPDPEKIFKKFDANGDGKWSKEEWGKYVEEMKAKVSKEQLDMLGKDFADKLFEKLDADKDGALSLEEFKKLAEARNQLIEQGKKTENK